MRRPVAIDLVGQARDYISAGGLSGFVRGKPLLTVSQAAVLLGSDRSTLYKAIGENRFPLPVVRLNRQILIPRAALERLINGLVDYDAEEDICKGGCCCPTCGTSLSSSSSSFSRTRATCSAARRSSSRIPSV